MATILSLVIKHHRATMGMSQEQLGEAVRVSASLIAMIETGRRIPKPDTAERLDDLFGTGTLIRDAAAVARAEHQPSWFREWPDVEAEALSLCWHEPLLIPGLLQTETYARTVLTSGLLTAERAEEYLTLRMARKAAVFSRPDPPVCTFMIDESALRRGAEPMRKEQLDCLLEMGERPGTFIHVIPYSAGLHVGLSGPFVVASLDGGETYAYVDDQLAGRVTHDFNAVAQLGRTWQAVCAVALPRDQSRDLIMKAVNEL